MRCPTVSRRLLVGGTALLGLVVGGCTGDPGPTAAPGPTALGPASATTAPGTTGSISREQQINDDYLAAFDAEVQAGLKADPDYQPLLDTHSGVALQRLKEDLAKLRTRGELGRLPDGTKSGVKIEETQAIDTQTARVTACVVDDTIVYVEATGHVEDDSLAAVRLEYVLKMSGDRWQVVDRSIKNEYEGASECADS